MSIAQMMMMEMAQEGATTRRVLEAIPEDKLGWKPHEKSMTMGYLALHIATAPGDLAKALEPDVFAYAGEKRPDPTTKAEILAAHDRSMETVKEALSKFDDAKMMAMWTFAMGGKELMKMPRVAAARGFVCSHTYHHRGQLSVYLRLVDAKVPSIYGPSADDNPFG